MRARENPLPSSAAAILAGLLATGRILLGCSDSFSARDSSSSSTTSGSGTGGDGTGAGGAGGSAGAGGDSGGGGTGGAIDPGCVPSTAGEPVAESCGVFVQASSMSGTEDGTKANPYRTIAAAIAAAKPMYVCAEAFTEAVNLPVGSVVFGGLDCQNGWGW